MSGAFKTPQQEAMEARRNRIIFGTLIKKKKEIGATLFWSQHR